jgi:hypothetical protein
MITWGDFPRGMITLRPDSLLQPQLFTREGMRMEVAAARVRTRVNQSPLCQSWSHKAHEPIIAMYATCRQLSYLGNQPRRAPIVLCVASPEEKVHMLTSSAEDAITAVIMSVTLLSLEKREKERMRA